MRILYTVRPTKNSKIDTRKICLSINRKLTGSQMSNQSSDLGPNLPSSSTNSIAQATASQLKFKIHNQPPFQERVYLKFYYCVLFIIKSWIFLATMHPHNQPTVCIPSKQAPLKVRACSLSSSKATAIENNSSSHNLIRLCGLISRAIMSVTICL